MPKALLALTLTLAACGLTDPVEPGDLELPTPQATVLAPVSGDDQVGGAGAELASPLRVRVLDQFGDPVEGIDVTFAVVAGGGSVAPVVSATNEDGFASAEWTLGGTLGEQQVSATTAPATTSVSFSATAIAGSPGSITIGLDTIEFGALGDTIRVFATAADAFGNAIAMPALTWSSDHPNRASVNGGGLVTATGPGTTRVIASSDGVADTVVVVVTQIPATVLVEPAVDTLIGTADSATLRARVFDGNGRVIAGAAIAWSSTEPAVATVGATGVVDAVAGGTTTIVAAHGTLADSATIVVREPAALTVTPAADSIATVGATATLAAVVTDANGDAIAGAPVQWASLDTLIARVDAYGRVTARDTGNARIVATLGALADTAIVSVAPPAPAPGLSAARRIEPEPPTARGGTVIASRSASRERTERRRAGR